MPDEGRKRLAGLIATGLDPATPEKSKPKPKTYLDGQAFNEAIRATAATTGNRKRQALARLLTPRET